MSTTTQSLPNWDLSDLYTSVNDSQIESDINSATERAITFRKQYQGKLNTITPAELHSALQELESLREQANKSIIYAMLLHAADTDNPEHGALLTKLQEKHTKLGEHLTFWSLEWNSLEEDTANNLLKSPELTSYAHYLSDSRKYKPYQLSEKEEILWQNLDLTGESAWSRLFDEVLSKIKFNITLPGEEPKEMSEEEVLSLLYNPCRETRKAASNSLTQGLKTQEHILAYIFNIILQDHAIGDRLRGYPHAKSSRNLSNEINDQAVDNLIQVTKSQSNLIQRFYALKKKLLGLDVMNDYDRYAPIPQEDTKTWSWQEACDFVGQAYQDFSPEAGRIVQDFYDKHWIDADLRPGKRGGAFSASAVPSVHPYILVNFTGTNRDVATLAHELGHGIHQYLSRSVGYLNADTPLTTAETASVFGEMLVFERMLRQSESKEEKLALLVGKLDDIFATVFRQICMTRFEERMHQARREQGELKVSDLNEMWIESNAEMFGESIEWTENYHTWWSYIPHFIHTPFYCYAYSFGLLLSITLYNQYKEASDKNTFVENYLKVLSAGGSMNPVDLLKIMDIDLNHPDFWQNGFNLVDQLITEAEGLVD